MQFNEEISWLQFSQLPSIKRMPLQEQIQRYNLLVEQMCMMRMHQYMNECGGASKPARRIISEGFLQQEDLFYILQEDGSKIYVTIEI